MIKKEKGIGIVLCCSVSLLVAGCGVSQPGRSETALMNWIKHRITVGNRTQQNPLGHAPEIARDGQAAFESYCVACHGLDGQNTGVPFAGNISPPIPSLASKQVQQYTDGQLKWIIENGLSPSGMPASRGILSDEEIWSIVEYLRHLPPAGSLGEPGIYTGACSAKTNESFAPEIPVQRPAGKHGVAKCAHS
jgi:mono/diheme cytochrome c family protein